MHSVRRPLTHDSYKIYFDSEKSCAENVTVQLRNITKNNAHYINSKQKQTVHGHSSDRRQVSKQVRFCPKRTGERFWTHSSV